MAERLQFATPVIGRFVSGDLTKKREKDKDNRPIAPEDQNFEFGVAFQKAEIWPMLVQIWYPWMVAQLAAVPHVQAAMTNWFTTMDGFSMKVTNGDLPNRKGDYNESTKGCFVIWFSSRFAPKGSNTADVEIDINSIKRGYYVQVSGSIGYNGLTDKNAGIYVSGDWVRLIAAGDEISGGVDAASAFGGVAAPTVLPPGAKPLPAAGAFSGPPAVPVAPAGAPPVQYAPAPAPMAPVVAPAGPPAAPTIASPGSVPGVVPHTGILSGPPGLPPS